MFEGTLFEYLLLTYLYCSILTSDILFQTLFYWASELHFPNGIANMLIKGIKEYPRIDISFCCSKDLFKFKSYKLEGICKLVPLKYAVTERCYF